jgi:hypothetical protein
MGVTSCTSSGSPRVCSAKRFASTDSTGTTVSSSGPSASSSDSGRFVPSSTSAWASRANPYGSFAAAGSFASWLRKAISSETRSQRTSLAVRSTRRGEGGDGRAYHKADPQQLA